MSESANCMIYFPSQDRNLTFRGVYTCSRQEPKAVNPIVLVPPGPGRCSSSAARNPPLRRHRSGGVPHQTTTPPQPPPLPPSISPLSKMPAHTPHGLAMSPALSANGTPAVQTPSSEAPNPFSRPSSPTVSPQRVHRPVKVWQNELTDCDPSLLVSLCLLIYSCKSMYVLPPYPVELPPSLGLLFGVYPCGSLTLRAI